MFVFIKPAAMSVVYPVRRFFTTIVMHLFSSSVADVGYNMYKKNYEEPKTSEGISEITHVEWSPKFDSDLHEKIFHYYTES